LWNLGVLCASVAGVMTTRFIHHLETEHTEVPQSMGNYDPLKAQRLQTNLSGAGDLVGKTIDSRSVLE